MGTPIYTENYEDVVNPALAVADELRSSSRPLTKNEQWLVDNTAYALRQVNQYVPEQKPTPEKYWECLGEIAYKTFYKGTRFENLWVELPGVHEQWNAIARAVVKAL